MEQAGQALRKLRRLPGHPIELLMKKDISHE